MTLEAYAKARKDFRARVLEHKRPRAVHLGEHVTLLFEDETTIRYQVQEMLRIEKIFDEEGIARPCRYSASARKSLIAVATSSWRSMNSMCGAPAIT